MRHRRAPRVGPQDEALPVRQGGRFTLMEKRERFVAAILISVLAHVAALLMLRLIPMGIRAIENLRKEHQRD